MQKVDGVDIDDLDLSKEEHDKLVTSEHIPTAIVGLMYEKIQELRKRGLLSEADQLLIDKNLNPLLDSMGACERIKNTPIPFSYSLFLKKFIFIYVTTLPLAFVAVFGYYSAIIATFVFYVLVSMEVLAEEIEDPFGSDDNDLPTDQLAEKIKRLVQEVLK